MKTNSIQKNTGITLIALVITIIVLLILAGVSIAMLTGESGLLTKASDAKIQTVVGQENDYIKLAYSSAKTKKFGGTVTAKDLQDELDESVGSGKTSVSGTSSLSVHFNDTNHNYSIAAGEVNKIADGEDPSQIKEVYVDIGGKAIILKNSGEVYKFNYDSQISYIKYEEEEATLLLSGVKKIYYTFEGNTFTYITTSDDLFYYDLTTNESELIERDIKEYYPNGAFLTLSNELCIYDHGLNSVRTISSNVKEYFIDGYYLTNANELCLYDFTLNSVVTISSNVKEYFIDGYYLTNANELKFFDRNTNTSSFVDVDVKTCYLGGYYLKMSNELCWYDNTTKTSTTLANNVKEFYYDSNNIYYLSTSNELYYYSNKISFVLKATGVKKYYDDGFYISDNNELLHDTVGNSPAHIDSNVKECCYYNGTFVYYLTTSNDFCKYRVTTQTETVLYSNVSEVGAGIRWFKTNSNELYLQYYAPK